MPMKPPNFVKKVYLSMLNFELVMSTVLSKVISNVLKGYGTDPRSLVVYMVFVQGDLHVYFIFL